MKAFHYIHRNADNTEVGRTVRVDLSSEVKYDDATGRPFADLDPTEALLLAEDLKKFAFEIIREES